MRPQGQIHRLVALIEQVVHRQIGAQGRVGLEFNAKIGDHLDFLVQNLARQTVRRNADPQHTPGLGQGLVDRRQHSPPCQMIRRRQTCGTRADDRDLLFARRRTLNLYLAAIKLIRGQALQIPDRHRIVHLQTTAGILTAVGADPTQHAG